MIIITLYKGIEFFFTGKQAFKPTDTQINIYFPVNPKLITLVCIFTKLFTDHGVTA